jgi:TRAP transporter TAXI family solute receptor
MAGGAPRKRGQLRNWLERIALFGPSGLLIVAAFVIAYHFVQPAPPRHIVMATGSKDGVYYDYGRIYRDLMAKEGIEVTLLETAGLVANVEFIARGEADVAFVQGGTRSGEGDTPLHALASLYYEPVWVFLRKDVRVSRLSDLRGRRVGIDREGSGTRAIALKLLADNGLATAELEMSPLGGSEAAAALRRGTLDAAFFVIGAKAPVVESLLAAPDIRLFSFERAEAYRRVHSFLSRLTLPEGAVSLSADLPPANTALIAPAANLVVSEDFHPALAELLLMEAQRIHGHAGVFEEADEFPSRRHLDYLSLPRIRFVGARPAASDHVTIGGDDHHPGIARCGGAIVLQVPVPAPDREPRPPTSDQYPSPRCPEPSAPDQHRAAVVRLALPAVAGRFAISDDSEA